MSAAVTRCSRYLDNLIERASPAKHLRAIAADDGLFLEAVSLQGAYREFVAAKVLEEGELLVHAATAAKQLSLVDKSLQNHKSRLFLRESEDGLAVHASLLLPVNSGGYSDPIRDEPFSGFSSTKVFVLPQWGLEPTEVNWDKAVRFSMDASVLRESLQLLAPIKTAMPTTALPRVFLEVADEDELIFSCCSGPALVVQRTVGRFGSVGKQLRGLGLDLPLEVGISMRVFSSLSAASTALPKTGAINVEVAMGATRAPRCLRFSTGDWELEMECLHRKDAANPRSLREEHQRPLLRRVYLEPKHKTLGQFSMLLQSALAFKPRGVVLGMQATEVQEGVLTLRGSSLQGMFDLNWPLVSDELFDDAAADTELVLPPRNLRSALDALPEDPQGLLRVDLYGGTRPWTTSEAEVLVLSVGAAETTRTAITLAGSHR